MPEICLFINIDTVVDKCELYKQATGPYRRSKLIFAEHKGKHISHTKSTSTKDGTGNLY